MEKQVIKLLNSINRLILDKNIIDTSTIELGLDSIEDWLNIAKKNGNNNFSNFLWGIQSLLKIKKGYIESFNFIKDKDYVSAWNLLANLENNLVFVENNIEVLLTEEHRRSVTFYKESVMSWQTLFPYKLFFSMGFTVGKHSCSICKTIITPRRRCIHKKGKLYNGELCFHVGNGLEIKEFSLVQNPMDKQCILMSENYDYSLVNKVSDLLSTPYDGWKAVKSTIWVSGTKFNELHKDMPCPCQKIKLFKDCCFGKNEIEIPHLDLYFEKNIDPSKLNNI